MAFVGQIFPVKPCQTVFAESFFCIFGSFARNKVLWTGRAISDEARISLDANNKVLN